MSRGMCGVDGRSRWEGFGLVGDGMVDRISGRRGVGRFDGCMRGTRRKRGAKYDGPEIRNAHVVESFHNPIGVFTVQVSISVS